MNENQQLKLTIKQKTHDETQITRDVKQQNAFIALTRANPNTSPTKKHVIAMVCNIYHYF